MTSSNRFAKAQKCPFSEHYVRIFAAKHDGMARYRVSPLPRCGVSPENGVVSIEGFCFATNTKSANNHTFLSRRRVWD